MLSKAEQVAMALEMAFRPAESCEGSITTSDDEEDNILTPTASNDQYARPYDTHSTTTATDEEGSELTPSASSDPTSKVFSACRFSSDGTITTVHDSVFTYRDCKPLHITNSLKLRDGHLFAVHFEDCRVGMFNIDNCIMIDVIFDNCTFRSTTFSNIFMRGVTVKDCEFEANLWQNDRRVDLDMAEQRYIGTVIGDEIPKEISDPEWLANELDGTNELIRAMEAGHIEDIKPNKSRASEPKENEDYATRKLREWEELANGNEHWWQW